MNLVRLQITRHLLNYVHFFKKVQESMPCMTVNGFYSTFTMEALSSVIIDQHKVKIQRFDVSELQHCSTTGSKYDLALSQISTTELDTLVIDLLSKNKDKHIEQLIRDCQTLRKYMNLGTLQKLLKYFSRNGKPDTIIILQNYWLKVNSNSYQRNGEFLHYLAIAQCMKGNSEIGLSILKSSYSKYDTLRSLYRIIMRDLIQDSVLNRSEASLMIFKKYVLEFSEEWSDHYPLVCFWHISWASTWFSDQMLANELLESSAILQLIVKEKAAAFSIMALKDYNEDAVVRLLQTLLKYDMMSEYVAVLEALFNYKLKNRDIRGCTEIIKNCEVLGVMLPSNQQGRYLTMLIRENKRDYEDPPTKLPFKNFKYKF